MSESRTRTKYTYDDLARVASANCGSAWNQTFNYDAFGNITKNATVGVSFTPGYSPTTNQFTSLPGITPTYDADGRLTSDGTHSYAWDAESKMHSVDTTTLTYDAFGRMVEKGVSTTYTQIVYSPLGTKIAVMSGQNLQQGFVPLPTGSNAVYTPTGLTYYRHTDHLGNSRLAATPSRTLYSSTAYAPFGEPYKQAGTTDLSFTGQDQDTVSGMHDFLDRRYTPVQGRWLTPDPIGLAAVDPASPQSWNRYAYVINNPLAMIDPFGDDGCYGDFLLTPPCQQPTQVTPTLPPTICTGVCGNPGDSGGGSTAANNGQQQQRTAAQCVGQALKAKGLSIALDVAGAVPVFGNLFSGTVEGIQALNAGYYGGLAVMNAGNTAMNPSTSGAVSTATTIGLTAASLALNGSKMVPVAGNVVSGLTGLYDSYQAYKTYQQCRAGGG